MGMQGSFHQLEQQCLVGSNHGTRMTHPVYRSILIAQFPGGYAVFNQNNLVAIVQQIKCSLLDADMCLCSGENDLTAAGVLDCPADFFVFPAAESTLIQVVFRSGVKEDGWVGHAQSFCVLLGNQHGNFQNF